MRFKSTALFALTILVTGTEEICRASAHRTVRFVHSSGCLQNFLAMAFSPSGEELAVSTG